MAEAGLARDQPFTQDKTAAMIHRSGLVHLGFYRTPPRLFAIRNGGDLCIDIRMKRECCHKRLGGFQ